MYLLLFPFVVIAWQCYVMQPVAHLKNHESQLTRHIIYIFGQLHYTLRQISAFIPTRFVYLPFFLPLFWYSRSFPYLRRICLDTFLVPCWINGLTTKPSFVGRVPLNWLVIASIWVLSQRSWSGSVLLNVSDSSTLRLLRTLWPSDLRSCTSP